MRLRAFPASGRLVGYPGVVLERFQPAAYYVLVRYEEFRAFVLHGDAAEALAIHLTCGEHAERLPVSGTKGLLGHALGANRATEAAITVLALDRSWLSPTANLEEPDPEFPLCYVPTPGTEASVDAALTNSVGLGGFNVSLALGR